MLSNLLSPAKPKDTSLAEIVQTLKNHYEPAPLEITESFHFGMRNQQTDESISDCIVALKKLSIHCNYGEFLNRALWDTFVCGLNNVKIQNKLLYTSSLKFDTACNIAISMKLARRNSREFRPNHGSGTGTTISVNKVSSGDSGNSRQPDAKCSRYNGNHSFDSFMEPLYIRISKLKTEDREEMEGPLPVEECKKALGTFEGDKTPGEDGFTVEFYKTFFDLIGQDLAASFNAAYEVNELSTSQRRGIVTLIPKEDGSLLATNNLT